MAWFKETFGFNEVDRRLVMPWMEVKEKFSVSEDGTSLTSLVSGRSFHNGRFTTPSVEELHAMIADTKDIGADEGKVEVKEEESDTAGRGLRFSQIGADVGTLHRDPAKAGALFQAASQFNCIEMVGPSVRPEDGITGYFYDRTQGVRAKLYSYFSH